MSLDPTQTILVASDDHALVTAISTSLHANGYAVCTRSPSGSPSPIVLHADLPAGSPSLIVLDVDLPPESRARLLHTCRSCSPRPTPPIVALSPRAKVRQTAAEEGVWVCLAKPIELDSLLTAITRITRHTAAA